jgi:hypothetical protein
MASAISTSSSRSAEPFSRTASEPSPSVTFEGLAREGEALRRRLATAGLSKAAMHDLAIDIHAWQELGIALVETQRSMDAASFHRAVELTRIRPGEWVPAASQQSRFDAGLADWLRLLAALDASRSPASRGRIVGPVD